MVCVGCASLRNLWRIGVVSDVATVKPLVLCLKGRCVLVCPSPQRPQHKETLSEEKESTDPWTRLYTSPTLSSARRDVTYFDPQVIA